jgi:VanZ family protein
MTAILRLFGWIGIAIIGVLSVVPGEARPHAFSPSQLEHVVAYLAVASTLALGYPGRRQFLAIVVLLTVYAGALEIAQLWVPGRLARVIDWLAGSAGAWTGASLVAIVRSTASAWMRPKAS